MTDAEGEPTATFSYGPFGGLEAATGTASTPLGFAGQYTDPETGLQYLRARWYDPVTGQFLTRDPLEAITRSPYGYVGENPLNAIDPGGLEAIPVPAVGAAGCAAGPAAAAACAGIGAAACALIPACRDAVGNLINSIFGDGDTGPSPLEEHQQTIGECRVGETGWSFSQTEGRNPAQDKKVTDRELEEAGLDAHDLKEGRKGTDIYKDREGNLYEKPKGGRGPGDPLGINIKDRLRR